MKVHLNTYWCFGYIPSLSNSINLRNSGTNRLLNVKKGWKGSNFCLNYCTANCYCVVSGEYLHRN